MKYNILSFLLVAWLSFELGSGNDEPEPTSSAPVYFLSDENIDPTSTQDTIHQDSTETTDQLPPAEHPPAEHQPAQHQPAQHQPAQHHPAQHHPAQHRPAPLPPAQIPPPPTSQSPPQPTIQPTTETTNEETPQTGPNPAPRPYSSQLDTPIDTSQLDTPMPEPPSPSSDYSIDVYKRNALPKVHGPDEIKVFFRDCKPYKKDCLFGGPVCATDRRTYPNFMYMECINYRRNVSHRVKVKHEGPCWSNPGKDHCPMDPIYDPVCGTDDMTYVNKLALECTRKKHGSHHLRVKYPGECIGRGYCYFSNYSWDKPVCASTGTTLQSYKAIKCLRSVGAGVEIAHDGHCTSKDLRNALQTRSAVCRKLRREVEPFPVCASNGKTYPSAAHVICKYPHLEIEFHTACEAPAHVACKEAKRLDAHHKCKPVCGSDGKSYNSQHHLHCARIFKTYLQVLHDGECQTLDSPCVRLYTCKERQEPVCATDGVTYISPLALECVAKYKKNGIEFRHTGPCLKNN